MLQYKRTLLVARASSIIDWAILEFSAGIAVVAHASILTLALRYVTHVKCMRIGVNGS